MKFTLLDLYSFSIGIAAIIGAVRYKKINPAYYPFIYLLWIGFATEILCYFLIYSNMFNAIPYNVYVLLEAVFLTWQFRRWGLFRDSEKLYYSLLISFTLFWCIEAFFIEGITHTTTWFRIYHSFIIVIMSLFVISQLLVRTQTPLLKNSTFLICSALIIYFTFNVFVEVFLLWGLKGAREFRIAIVMIPVYLNVLANLIFAVAVLWMPRKLPFTMRL